jgi:uncharacterized membrane protein
MRAGQELQLSDVMEFIRTMGLMGEFNRFFDTYEVPNQEAGTAAELSGVEQVIAEALAKATPGPWKAYRSENETQIGTAWRHSQLEGYSPIVGHAYGREGEFVFIREEDAHLIANAPEWLHYLLIMLAIKQSELEANYKRQKRTKEELERRLSEKEAGVEEWRKRADRLHDAELAAQTRLNQAVGALRYANERAGIALNEEDEWGWNQALRRIMKNSHEAIQSIEGGQDEPSELLPSDTIDVLQMSQDILMAFIRSKGLIKEFQTFVEAYELPEQENATEEFVHIGKALDEHKELTRSRMMNPTGD